MILGASHCALNVCGDETGATMTDYAMLLALIAVSTMAAIQALRSQIDTVFNDTASTLGSVK